MCGRHLRRQLVHSVREEYEKTVKEIEGGESSIRWPRRGTLCFPVFAEPGEEVVTPDQDESLSSGQLQTDTPALPHTPVTMEDVSKVCLSSLSSMLSSGNSPDKDGGCVQQFTGTDSTKEVRTLTFPHSHQPVSECGVERGDELEPLQSRTNEATSTQNGTNESQKSSQCEMSEGRDMLIELLLESEPLVGDNFPKDKCSLLELRSQTAMELAWLKQAIASRRKVSVLCTAALNSYPTRHISVTFCSISRLKPR